MEELLEKIPNNFALLWIAMFIVVIIVLCKYLPKIVSSLNVLRKHINELEDLNKTIKKNTADIDVIQGKIGRDYARLNSIERIVTKQQEMTNESLEERELILRSLLGIIQGLQEMGANGPTKKAEAEIQSFLIKQSHKKELSNVES